MSIHNAKITSTFLGPEDHGIMTFFVHFIWDGYGIGYGGYALDGFKREEKRHFPLENGRGYQAIREILDCLGVKNWEDLAGNLCRIDFGDGPKIIRIGHILEDRWFDLSTYMKDGVR